MQCVYRVYSNIPRLMRVLVWCLGLALFVLLLMYVSGKTDYSRFKSIFSKEDNEVSGDTTRETTHDVDNLDPSQDLDNQRTSRGNLLLNRAPSPQNKSSFILYLFFIINY